MVQETVFHFYKWERHEVQSAHKHEMGHKLLSIMRELDEIMDEVESYHFCGKTVKVSRGWL